MQFHNTVKQTGEEIKQIHQQNCQIIRPDIEAVGKST